MSEAMELTGTGRARPGFWLGRGWDWFFEFPGQHLLAGLLTVALIGFSQSLLLGPALVGLAAIGVRKDRLKRLEVADFFEGFRLFVPAFLSGLLVICFTLFGLVFLIVPGFVIFAMYLFTFHFIFDQGHDFWQAMESSRKLVSRDYFGFTLFAAAIVAINLLGLAFFVVGSVATAAITGLAVTAAYLDCTGSEWAAPTPDAKPILIE